MNLEIFQIYFNDKQEPYLDKEFTPLINSSKLAQYREWPVIRQSLLIGEQRNLDAWGFVSYKYKEKVDVAPSDFVKLVTDNPDSDCWFLEPITRNDDIFDNPWRQGDFCHPGLMKITKTIFARLGYTLDPETDKIPNCFFSFYVMNKPTWEKYIDTLGKIKEIVDADPELSHYMYVKSSQYTLDRSLPYWIFFVERFITSFVIHENIRYSTLKYNNSVFMNEFYR